jgi:hypothetical protein
MLAKLQAYKFIGFNRLSMGVQSMDNDRLHFLGRIHTPLNVERDMDLIRRKGFYNVNLDLMFSVPGQTTEDALADVERILSFEPEHISCYSLQIEEGTPFASMIESGEMTEVSDEEDRETYHKICAKLKEAGYEHYEISNFAKPGYRSQHNSLYWNMDDYVGLGLGASGFLSGVRYKNTSDFDEYFKTIDEGRLPVEEEHVKWYKEGENEPIKTGYYLTTPDGTSLAEGTYYALIEHTAENDADCDGTLSTIKYEVKAVANGPKLAPSAVQPQELITIFNLNAEQVSNISIYRSTGELLESFQVNKQEQTTFNAAQQTGIYLVEILTETEKVTLRYIVK